MESLIERFGSVIADITGTSEPILTATTEPCNVIRNTGTYFSATSGDISFHHGENSNILLVVDSRGINYYIERIENLVCIESIEFIDRYGQFVHFRFGVSNSNEVYNVLLGVAISKARPSSSSDVVGNDDRYAYQLPTLVSSIVVISKFPFTVRTESVYIGQCEMLLHVQQID